MDFFIFLFLLTALHFDDSVRGTKVSTVIVRTARVRVRGFFNVSFHPCKNLSPYWGSTSDAAQGFRSGFSAVCEQFSTIVIFFVKINGFGHHQGTWPFWPKLTEMVRPRKNRTQNVRGKQVPSAKYFFSAHAERCASARLQPRHICQCMYTTYSIYNFFLVLRGELLQPALRASVSPHFLGLFLGKHFDFLFVKPRAFCSFLAPRANSFIFCCILLYFALWSKYKAKYKGPIFREEIFAKNFFTKNFSCEKFS